MTTTIQFLATEHEWNAPDVQEAWQRLMAVSANPSALFQSPEWFENKYKTKREELRVAVVQNSAKITAVAPLLLAQQEFDLKLCRMQFRTAQFLGGEGLMPEEAYEELFKTIFQKFDVDAIHFRLLHTNSACWKAVQSSRAGFVRVHEQFKMYFVGLPGTFDEYLAGRFDSPHRRDLKKRVKSLREQGELRLQRISAPEDVPEFLRVGGKVACASWQAAKASYLIEETPEWNAHLSDLGRRGILRSYLLWCDSRPCAYVLGFQGGGYYHYSFAGYDQSMAKFSPGTVMLLFIIEDLIQHNHPGKLNFGEGEDEYKRRFSSEATGVANVTILRRSMKGRLRAAAFGAYSSLRDRRRRYEDLSGDSRGSFAKGRRLGGRKAPDAVDEYQIMKQLQELWARRTGLTASRIPLVSIASEDGPR